MRLGVSSETAFRAAYLIASLSALAVVMCARAARPPEVVQKGVLDTSARPASPSASAGGRSAPATSAPSAQIGRGLVHFQSALRALEPKARAGPVRVLWMGDSHAAADFWPDAVRKPLQERFGAGGPGFLYVGLGVYRHAGVKVTREGNWHIYPKQPSLWMRQEDGIFGLGGIRVVPDDAASRVKLELTKGAVKGEAAWDLAYRLPSPRARLEVSVEGGQTFVLDSKTVSPSGISHFTWKTPEIASVVVQNAVEQPEIFGIVIESTAAGVVVDTLGINGARIGTPLAWDEESWVSEARRRSASLFVLAYGTNEVGDAVAPWRYGPELAALIERARKSAPETDCLVLGPTDRAGPDFATLPRVMEIDAMEEEVARQSGCVYWSTFRAMGGEGSLKRWASQDPPLAAPDRVHLTPRGYGELGAMLLGVALGEPARAP